MRIIADDHKKTTMLDYFEGKPVRFYRVKATGDVGINSEDMAQVMGYKDFQELMSQDETLDKLNEWKRDNPGQPFFSDINL